MLAYILTQINADVLCLLEVYSRDTVSEFNQRYLSSLAYTHVVIAQQRHKSSLDMNIVVLSRFPINAYSLHYGAITKGDFQLPRACIEIDVILPSSSPSSSSSSTRDYRCICNACDASYHPACNEVVSYVHVDPVSFVATDEDGRVVKHLHSPQNNLLTLYVNHFISKYPNNSADNLARRRLQAKLVARIIHDRWKR